MTGRTRIVVFHAVTAALKSRYYGIVTQGFPQLVRVNNEVLKLSERDDIVAMMLLSFARCV